MEVLVICHGDLRVSSVRRLYEDQENVAEVHHCGMRRVVFETLGALSGPTPGIKGCPCPSHTTKLIYPLSNDRFRQQKRYELGHRVITGG